MGRQLDTPLAHLRLSSPWSRRAPTEEALSDRPDSRQRAQVQRGEAIAFTHEVIANARHVGKASQIDRGDAGTTTKEAIPHGFNPRQRAQVQGGESGHCIHEIITDARHVGEALPT